MQQVHYEVVHSIPGRIRIRTPLLKDDLDYGIKLQGLIESWEFVNQVDIDRAAESIIVQYQQVLTAQLQQKLANAIEQATESDLPALTVKVSFGGYESVSLTLYEFAQVKKIQQWWTKEPKFLSNAVGEVFHPVKATVDTLTPPATFTKIIELCNTVTSQWQKDGEKLKSSAGVDDYHQLKQTNLEVCDRLTAEVEGEALKLAAIEGSLTGCFDIVGEVADIGLWIVLALQTVHRIGLCYGYSPETETEQKFAWAILGVATANTVEERSSALKILHDLHYLLYKEIFADITEETIEETVEEATIESIVEQVIASLVQDTTGEAIPILGIGFGIMGDRLAIAQVGVSARSAFQLRWLLENQKIRLSPALSAQSTQETKA